MLKDSDATTVISVKDVEVARRFYEGTLGFEPAETAPGMIFYRSGASSILVYESQFAGTNQANAVAWSVADIDSIVQDLQARGVTFEHYDLPGLKLEGDLHVGEGFKGVWFKDADGNILHVNNGTEGGDRS